MIIGKLFCVIKDSFSVTMKSDNKKQIQIPFVHIFCNTDITEVLYFNKLAAAIIFECAGHLVEELNLTAAPHASVHRAPAYTLLHTQNPSFHVPPVHLLLTQGVPSRRKRSPFAKGVARGQK